MTRRVRIPMLLLVLACRPDEKVIDTGGRSLDVPVPSTGTAATISDARDVAAVARRVKTDATRLGIRTGPLGAYVVDGNGRALYVFSGDDNGQSACLTNCAAVWPPVEVEELPREIDARIHAPLLELISRPDGAHQLAIARMPLYYSESDRKPGDTWGHSAMSFGGRFTLVSPAGQPLPIPR